MQPHLTSHCLPPLSIVVHFIFPPGSLVSAILPTSELPPQKWAAGRTADCSEVEAIVSLCHSQETALQSPPKYFSCKQWHASESVSHHERQAGWPRSQSDPGCAHIQLHVWTNIILSLVDTPMLHHTIATVRQSEKVRETLRDLRNYPSISW